MGKKFLIDTNILLGYIGGVLPANAHELVEEAISSDFNISVINRIEVLGHHSANKSLCSFLDLSKQYELSLPVVEQTILIRKVVKIKLPDAIIAATAIVHNFVLLSRNTKDFKNIDGLKILDPYSL